MREGRDVDSAEDRVHAHVLRHPVLDHKVIQVHGVKVIVCLRPLVQDTTKQSKDHYHGLDESLEPNEWSSADDKEQRSQKGENYFALPHEDRRTQTGKVLKADDFVEKFEATIDHRLDCVEKSERVLCREIKLLVATQKRQMIFDSFLDLLNH